jgi:hypothetical protein
MRGLSARTLELIRFARQLLADHHPMTLRQLHYAVFSASRIPYDNTPADYKRLSRVTTMGRRNYRELELAGDVDRLDDAEALIPPDWIVDELREAERVSLWQDCRAFMATVKRAYRRDYWQDQPNYVELWSEKATVLGSMRPITERYGVMLRACRGFGSTGMESQIGSLFEGIDKPITVFYLGDHDPSGHSIEQDIHRRAEVASGKDFDMIRLAIHETDIRTYNLPPQRIKATDSRAAGFRRQFGSLAATVELDALPVEVLRDRVENAIKEEIDWELWDRQVIVEEAELKCIAEFADRVRNLPQAPQEGR